MRTTNLQITNNLNYQRMKSIFNAFVAWAFGLFIPVLVYLQVVYFVVFADFVVGVTAALLAHERFSWQKALTVVGKFVAFSFLIAATYQIQTLLQIPPIVIGEFQLGTAVLVAGVLCVAELKSILRNIKSAFGIDIIGYLGDKVPIIKALDTEQKTETEQKSA
jgi:hypothetical protein